MGHHFEKGWRRDHHTASLVFFYTKTSPKGCYIPFTNSEMFILPPPNDISPRGITLKVIIQLFPFFPKKFQKWGFSYTFWRNELQYKHIEVFQNIFGHPECKSLTNWMPFIELLSKSLNNYCMYNIFIYFNIIKQQ